jgi:isopentenyl diphosphate isomerase/L-lactate dehydrogenase-like FMN-dependent dehydrogenase
MTRYGDYQNEIYLGGLSGNLPNQPVSFAELAAQANAALSPSLLSYVAGGCGDEQTQNVNVTALQHWGMIPRMMVGASQRDLSIQLFGMSLPTPIFMAPIGVVGLCAQDGHGDIATVIAHGIR